MIARCLAAGLPEPTFEQRSGQFVTTVWRDWLIEAVMDDLGLNERQKKAMVLFRQVPNITNTAYQEATGASRATAKRDLDELIDKGILTLEGRGCGAHYTKMKKGLKNGSNGSSGIWSKNGS